MDKNKIFNAIYIINMYARKGLKIKVDDFTNVYHFSLDELDELFVKDIIKMNKKQNIKLNKNSPLVKEYDDIVRGAATNV